MSNGELTARVTAQGFAELARANGLVLFGGLADRAAQGAANALERIAEYVAETGYLVSWPSASSLDTLLDAMRRFEADGRCQ